jgi:predicted MFS family arabinose efflux permease
MGTVGEVFIYLVPVLLGSVVESFAMSDGNAGLLVALEIASSAVAAVTCAALLAHLPIRRFAFISILVVVICDLLSAVVQELSVFVGLRVTAALGAGALFALANALAAKTGRPEKTFSLMGFTVILAATLGFMAMTFAIQSYGPQAAFAALAALTALGLPFLWWLPAEAPRSRAPSGGGLTGVPINRRSVAMFGAMLVLFVGQYALWVYVERIGGGAGLTLEQISTVLIANGFISCLGPIAAHRLGNRIGYAWPIAAGLSLQGMTMLLLVYSTNLPMYALSVIALSLSYVFAIPFLRAVMAGIDRSGGVAAASTAFVTIGSAAGPAVGGLILNAGGSYTVIGWLAVVLLALTIAMVLPVARGVDRQVAAQ